MDTVFIILQNVWPQFTQGSNIGSIQRSCQTKDNAQTQKGERQIVQDSNSQTLLSIQVCSGGKRKKDEISVDCLDFNKKILHTAWHPQENIIAVAATNNLFLFQVAPAMKFHAFMNFFFFRRITNT